MIYVRLKITYCVYLLLLEIRCHHAYKGTSTSINEDDVPNLVNSRFFDPANMGLPNFAPERFGNLGSNYPTGSTFFPFGNQFPNFRRSASDYGNGILTQYPIQENFQRPPGGPNQNRGVFPESQGVYRPGFNRIFDPPRHKVSSNQNNPTASVPDNVSFLRINRPYTNEESYQFGQHNPGHALQFPTPNGNPIQDGNFVPDSNYYPKSRSQFPNRPIDYPIDNTLNPDDNNVYQDQNQYPARNNFHNSGNPNNLPQYILDFQTPQNPQNNQESRNVYHPVYSLNQIPINQGTENDYGFNFNENINDAPQIIPTLPDHNQLADSGETDSDRKVAILGKPVILPPEIIEASDADEESSKNAVQKQCVQDCETTSEYNPICGTNNVTYINPGKFACARNCGVDLSIWRYGRCNHDPASNYTPYARQ